MTSNGGLNNSSSIAVVDKDRLEKTLKRRFFYTPSSEIYGGVSGLYDLGPVGAAIEAQIVSFWRKHFVIRDSMHEVRTCQLTPRKTFLASGHVDRFTDVMVKDTMTGETYRCDHLIKDHMESLLENTKLDISDKERYQSVLSKLDDLTGAEMKSIIDEYKIVAPITKNLLSDPVDFNLMFSTNIGCSNAQIGYLRPETAQGIFVNFKRLLESNNGRLPMAVAQVGVSFRNEISPRGGLLRCREFLMAEIEHFVHPEQKYHPRFKQVADIAVHLCSAGPNGNLPAIEMTLGEAVKKRIIANDLLAYYLGRSYQFLSLIGMDMTKVRFRQHLPNEMAHYACDCWDCEILTFHGWVECIGHADRSCYDLDQHSKACGQNLAANVNLTQPKIQRVFDLKVDKAWIGREFREEAPIVLSHVESFDIPQVIEFHDQLITHGSYTFEHNGKSYTMERFMLKSLAFTDREVFTEDVSPHVIEPSFGIGRILYSLLCHTCMVREKDIKRIWFNFPSLVAPYKCLILPLSNKESLEKVADKIVEQLSEAEISYRVDDLHASIGKRYARGDELGIPFAITIDFDTINKPPISVTLRERNTLQQIRIELNDVSKILKKLIRGKTSWSSVVETYGLFTKQYRC